MLPRSLVWVGWSEHRLDDYTLCGLNVPLPWKVTITSYCDFEPRHGWGVLRFEMRRIDPPDSGPRLQFKWWVDVRRA